MLKPQELPEEELDETQTAEWRQRKKHIFILSESGLSTQGESAKWSYLWIVLCPILPRGDNFFNSEPSLSV